MTYLSSNETSENELSEPTLDELNRFTADGKEVISLEDFLAIHLKRPISTQETLRLNCSSILRLLGVVPAGNSEAKRAGTWLRANNFYASQRGKVWKVALVHAQSHGYVIL